MLKKSGKILLAILLVISASILLSGCLVKQKDAADVVTIARTTDFLRVYQPGDWIEYNISVVDLNTFDTNIGVLRVQWESTVDLSDPITTAITHSVLKETTTITIDGATDPESIVIRYISQDANGVMTLHAIDDGTDLYWPFTVGTTYPTSPSETVTPQVIFDSPMAIGTPPVNNGQSFEIAQCKLTNQCNDEIYTYTDSAVEVVGDSTPVTTGIGIFSDPFKITFSGGISPSGALALILHGDIRDACGASDETILHGDSAGVGNFFVVPEIGIVRMEYNCQVTVGSGAYKFYTATLSNISFTFP